MQLHLVKNSTNIRIPTHTHTRINTGSQDAHKSIYTDTQQHMYVKKDNLTLHMTLKNKLLMSGRRIDFGILDVII